MIIYNVTIKVDWTIHEEWLQWMKQEYLPEVMATNHFTRHQLVRLLQVEESDGPTYAVQFYADSLESCNAYIANFAAAQHQKSVKKWGSLFVDFSTLMELVQ